MLECPYCNYEYSYIGITKDDYEIYQCNHCKYICDWNGRHILNKRKIG